MSIIRGTTPSLTFHVKDETLDLTEIAEIWITFKSKAGVNPKEKTFNIDDVVIDNENHTITLNLTQDDTLDFMVNDILVQLRVRFNNNMAYASSIIETTIGRILKEGVI